MVKKHGEALSKRRKRKKSYMDQIHHCNTKTAENSKRSQLLNELIFKNFRKLSKTISSY